MKGNCDENPCSRPCRRGRFHGVARHRQLRGTACRRAGDHCRNANKALAPIIPSIVPVAATPAEPAAPAEPEAPPPKMTDIAGQMEKVVGDLAFKKLVSRFRRKSKPSLSRTSTC